MTPPRSNAWRALFDRFAFAPLDPRAAGLFRIAFACGLIRFFWPEGRPLALPMAAVPGAPTLYAEVFLTPAWWTACVAATVLWGAGWRPRLSAVAVVAGLTPLAFLLGVEKGRQILLVSLVVFSFVPGRAQIGAWQLGGGKARAGPIWPLRLVQLQLSLAYAVNAVFKTTPVYLSGDVLVALSQALPNFRVDLASGFLDLGFVAVPVWWCAVGTVAIEYALAIGFWIPRLRVPTALLGVAFHSGLRFVIAIGWLDGVCMLLYLAFLLPPAFREREMAYST